MIDNREVGLAIASYRRRMGCTQQELADKLNVSHQAVSKWELGMALPDIETLMRLSDLFGVSMEGLLHGQCAPDVPSEEAVPEDEPARDEPAQTEPTRDEPAQTEPDGDATADEAAAMSDEKTARTDENAADWERIWRLAPFMSRPALDNVVLRCRAARDYDRILKIAPFVSTKTLDTLVSECSDDIDDRTLQKLAPFLSRETVDRLAMGMRLTEEAERQEKEMPEDAGKEKSGGIWDSLRGIGDEVRGSLENALGKDFGANIADKVKRALREGLGSITIDLDADKKPPVPEEDAARVDSVKNRVAMRAVAEHNWGWIEDNLDDITDADALAEIARHGDEYAYSFAEEIAPRLRPEDREAMAREMARGGFWDELEDVFPLLEDKASIAREMAQAGSWDALEDAMPMLDEKTRVEMMLYALEAGQSDFIEDHMHTVPRPVLEKMLDEAVKKSDWSVVETLSDYLG